MLTVAILLIQTLAAAAACYGLWLAWRRFQPAPRPFFLTVTFGLLARVAGAEVLFWVSYLRLPVARSLQLEDGFWFFGGDGLDYFQAAEHYARMGAGGIFHIPASAAAPGFIRVIAWLIYICGDSAFVAILLNCICYLVTAAVLLALVRRDEQLEKPGLVGLLALSFAPSLLLWSTQALKDPFTICLIALFVGCCISWQDLWTRELPSPALAWRAAALAAAVLAIIHEITAVRWYVAAALCIGMPLSSLAMFFVSRRRLLASASGIALSVLAAATILVDAKDYIPEQFNLFSSNRIASIARLPKSVFTWVDRVRTGYDLTPGATAIGVGPLLAPSAAHTSVPGPAASAPISEMPAPPKGIKPAPAQTTKKSPRPAASVVNGSGSLAEIDVDSSRLRPRPLPETTWPALISVNGGGSFWFFVEADTVVLDILVAFAAVYFIQLLRRGCVSPALISVGLSWIVLTATLVYSISNFGTLFRMRAMIFAVLAFVPLVMVLRRRQISRDAAGQPAAGEAASIPLTERLAAEPFELRFRYRQA